MKKKHRNKHIPGTPRIERVKVKDMLAPWDGPYDETKQNITIRMRMNIEKTGHPLHHQTADGTVVEPDPTLETLMTYVSPDEMPPIPTPLPGALPTVPVVRDWYEREPGRTWLKRWSASQHKPAEPVWPTNQIWAKVREMNKGRAQSASDKVADKRAAVLIKTLSPAQRAEVQRVATRIAYDRADSSGTFRLAVSRRADGSLSSFDDVNLVVALREEFGDHGQMESLVIEGLTEAQEAGVYTIINGIDLSVYGIDEHWISGDQS